MKKSVLNSSVIATQQVIEIPTNQIEIPKEWYELHNEDEKEDFIQELKESIEKNGYNPLKVFKYENKYVIVDGVLRFKVLSGLDINQLQCKVLEIDPQSEDEVKDLMIELQIKSVYSNEEILKIILHYLRIGKESLDGSTINKRVRILAQILGKGWCRSNIFFFLSILRWEIANPDSHLKISERILKDELSINKGKEAVDILSDQTKNFDIEKEIESGLLENFLDGNIRFRDELIKKIKTYNDKNDERYTPINVREFIKGENYTIINSDAREVVFLKDTVINGIFTSPPYYQQVRYSKPDDPNFLNELGWEKTVEEYCENVVSAIKKGADQMVDDGVIMINLNDTYKNGISLRVTNKLINRMCDEGYFYIQTINWVKDDAKPMGNSVNRFLNTTEVILIFSKSKRYYYNQFKLRNDNKIIKVSKGCSEQGKISGTHLTNPFDQCKDFMTDTEFTTYLKVAQNSGRSQDELDEGKFFGSFPTRLPVPFIQSFIPEGGTVYDPFGGTGTTGRVCLSLGRKVIINELLEKNIPNIEKMLETGATSEQLGLEDLSIAA